jgi:hypothetical protein
VELLGKFEKKHPIVSSHLIAYQNVNLSHIYGQWLEKTPL